MSIASKLATGKKPSADNLRESALEYASRGWPVLPCRPQTKRPLLTGWQRSATTNPATIERWWADGQTCNIGVQLGARSLIIDVECDSPEAERELAALLDGHALVVPTFVGKRGKHRLFRWSPNLPNPNNAVFNFRGVEFRTGNGGKGAQSLFPPSIHPDGPVYTWLVHPDDADPVPFPAEVLESIRASMDAPVASPLTLSTAQQTQQIQAHPLHVSTIIAKTLPTGPGHRNTCLLDLARHLKGIIPNATPDELRNIVREWHRQALPFIRTKDFSTTWAEFAVTWARVKRPVGCSLCAAVEAGESDMPPNLAAEYDGHLRQLVALCWQLQLQWGERPFPLGCREAGKCLGISKTAAWVLLQALQFDGVLALVGDKGTKASERASEYRFQTRPRAGKDTFPDGGEGPYLGDRL